MIIMCECLPIWGVAIVLYHVHTVEGRLLFLHNPLKIGAVQQMYRPTGVSPVGESGVK